MELRNRTGGPCLPVFLSPQETIHALSPDLSDISEMSIAIHRLQPRQRVAVHILIALPAAFKVSRAAADSYPARRCAAAFATGLRAPQVTQSAQTRTALLDVSQRFERIERLGQSRAYFIEPSLSDLFQQELGLVGDFGLLDNTVATVKAAIGDQSGISYAHVNSLSNASGDTTLRLKERFILDRCQTVRHGQVGIQLYPLFGMPHERKIETVIPNIFQSRKLYLKKG
jgi:hypothetical protein